MRSEDDDVVGSTFQLGDIQFMVVDVSRRPAEWVRKRCKELNVRSEHVVAVRERNELVSNIATAKGVRRLKRIAIEGEVLSRPQAISVALKIRESFRAYPLKRVKK